MQKRHENVLNTLIVISFGTSGILRWISLPSVNADMSLFYIKFYDYFAEHGFSALGDNFSLGTPLYLYLIWLATLTRNFISPLIALKLESIIFDLISAIVIYKIVKLKFTKGQIPLLASAIFLLLPTVIMNSSLWGQIDSLYASFLLLCIYFLLKEQPIFAMIAFGVSISFKLQACFIFPFLWILTFKKRILWYHYIIPPVVYVVTTLPAVLAGKSFIDALTLYLSWTSLSSSPAANAPNWYSLATVPPFYVDWATLINIGLVFAAFSILLWVILYTRKKYVINQGNILLTALAGFALVPFVLPKMNDRYFYMADILSLVLVFYYPSYWYLPIFYQVASGIVYYNFLFSVEPSEYFVRFVISAIFTTLALVILLIKQHQETNQKA